ncbi:hypothetical protein ACFWIQ_16545 [Kitasatospora sp. NPDC127059]|uniref:hypothetical protein n=1 Tax=unclassified Kitasatospora TaxID=2633591 RepID=UPI003663F219
MGLTVGPVAAGFNSLTPARAPVTPSVPDDFDWPGLESFLFHPGFAADGSDAALNLHRLLFAVQRIAYREAAGRNAPWPAARLHPRSPV